MDTTVTSAGRFKTEGLPETPLTPEERGALQASVDEAYAQFIADVSAGRCVSPVAVRDGFGQGRVVGASEALKAHMIDAVETIDVTLERVANSRTERLAPLAKHRMQLVRAALRPVRMMQVRAELAAHRRA